VGCAAVSSAALGSQAGAPECAPHALGLVLGPAVSPMMGKHADLFDLENRSRRSCVLNGYPGVRLSHGSTSLAFVYARGGGQYVTRRKCQWPLVSPHPRPSFLPTGGHVFSPLVATNLPTHRGAWLSVSSAV
jgi:Protein of unknown function (DUF4232)